MANLFGKGLTDYATSELFKNRALHVRVDYSCKLENHSTAMWLNLPSRLTPIFLKWLRWFTIGTQDTISGILDASCYFFMSRIFLVIFLKLADEPGTPSVLAAIKQLSLPIFSAEPSESRMCVGRCRWEASTTKPLIFQQGESLVSFCCCCVIQPSQHKSRDTCGPLV